ncbi:hypothetical protein PROFUN_09267 [Planoprotostelium fungivorum]|uniref:Uncharacterized protein n=1 Tax=Planoprotostelium fungivorum TaxID=1890364 RepID=A0A2P6NKV8_9EUKA|nr:hypothetical protein PROFUN_09267 [Planoprotostelium fungivorum]
MRARNYSTVQRPDEKGGIPVTLRHRQIIFCSAHKAATTKNAPVHKNSTTTSDQEHTGSSPLWPLTGNPSKAKLLTAPTD